MILIVLFVETNKTLMKISVSSSEATINRLTSELLWADEAMFSQLKLKFMEELESLF